MSGAVLNNESIDSYANALLAVARAEGNLETTRSELSAVSRAVEANEELRSTLSNKLIPASTRNQIVDDLLANRTSDTTRALVGMIVSTGRGAALGQIVDRFLSSAAAAGGKRLAVVRSAVALSDEQKAGLSSALESRTGHQVEIENVLDPDVIGGVVTTIGDTVIDGSVKSRLNKMKESL